MGKTRQRERWDTSDFWPIIVCMIQTIIWLGGSGVLMLLLSMWAKG